MHFGRRKAEQDASGNPEVRPLGPCLSCVVAAAFLAWECWSKMDDPFYKRYPENLYVLAALAVLSLGAAIGLHFTRVTLAAGRVIEHMPLLWHKELAVSDLQSIDNEGHVTFLRFSGDRKIGLVHMFSGVPGLLEALRKVSPRLEGLGP